MITAISVPTPFSVGPVNCHLIEDDPLTLVDTGPRWPQSLAVLEAGLAERGHRVEDLERIVLTHQHLDHIGLAGTLAQRSGAEVCALAALVPWLADYEAQSAADDAFAQAVMREHGVPEEVVAPFGALMDAYRGLGDSVAVTRPLVPGAELAFADRRWRILHRPGHSPSDVVFHDEAARELIGGDHLLQHILSNPIVTRPLSAGTGARPATLPTYLASLRATRALDVERVWPGHGAAFTGHRKLIDERLAGHERRASRIARVLAGRSLSAFAIAHERWGDVVATQAYPTLSTVLGCLDVLAERGLVSETTVDGVPHFRATDAPQ